MHYKNLNVNLDEAPYDFEPSRAVRIKLIEELAPILNREHFYVELWDLNPHEFAQPSSVILDKLAETLGCDIYCFNIFITENSKYKTAEQRIVMICDNETLNFFKLTNDKIFIG